jgi:hypothetical protein
MTFFYPEDGGSRFSKTLVMIYQTPWCHIKHTGLEVTHYVCIQEIINLNLS